MGLVFPKTYTYKQVCLACQRQALISQKELYPLKVRSKTPCEEQGEGGQREMPVSSPGNSTDVLGT